MKKLVFYAFGDDVAWVPEERRAELGGVQIVGEVTFRALNGMTIWLHTYETYAREELVCGIQGAVEFTLEDIIEDALRYTGDRQLQAERDEIAAYLRYLAGWLERGCNSRM